MATLTKLALYVVLVLVTATAALVVTSGPVSALPAPNKWNLDPP